MNSQILPSELTDRIIDYLWNDSKALSSCALVSSACISTVRFHRFGSIHLRWTAIVRFYNLLLASPSVAPYVLTMRMFNNGLVTSKMTAICGIFSMLSNLRTLHLAHFIVTPDEVQDLVTSLPTSLESIEVNQIDVPSVGDLIFLWTRLPRLRSFTVMEVLWFRSGTIPEEYRGEDVRISLSELHILWRVIHFDALVEWLCSHGVATQLRVCSLYIMDSGPAVGKLLRALGPALESLELLVTAQREEGPDSSGLNGCDLVKCTKLKELRMYASFERTYGHGVIRENSLCWVPYFLKQVRTPTIKTIVFAIERSPGDGGYSGLVGLRDAVSPLSRNVYGGLEEVIVHLYDRNGRSVGDEVFTAIRRDLARFELLGMLKTEVCS